MIILPGRLTLPEATSWKTETAGATRSREKFWQALLDQIDVPGAQLEWNREHDPSQRNVGFQLHYPGHLTEQLRNPDSVIKPFVLLEISHGSVARSAREPSITQSVSSAVHDWLAREGRLDAFEDNRPAAVSCVHPYVTLLEKLDAITRRYDRPDDKFDPGTFARHYEDAGMIIRKERELPPLEINVTELAHLMRDQGQIRRLALLCQVIPLGYRVTGSWQYGQRKRMTFKIAVSTSWRLISGRLGLGGGAARFSRRALFPRV